MSEQHIDTYPRHRREHHSLRRGERRPRRLEELALTAWALAAGYEQTGDEAQAAAARRALDFALEHLCRPDGSFAPGPGESAVRPGGNGLMIAALARGGSVLGERKYLAAAQEARLFLKTRLTSPDGRLHGQWQERRVSGAAEQADYALCVLGLLELARADGSRFALRQGEKLAGILAEEA